MTDVKQNHAMKIAPTAIVLPYLANTGLRALLAREGAQAFLVTKARPIDLFFKGMVGRLNCGFRTRQTVGLACQEFSTMRFNDSTLTGMDTNICGLGADQRYEAGWVGLNQFRVQCSTTEQQPKVEFDEGAVSSKFCFMPRGETKCNNNKTKS